MSISLIQANFLVNTKTLISMFLFITLTACSGGSEPPIKTVDQTKDAEDVLTEEITFTGGQLVNGSPPAATNNPNDPFLTNPSSEPATVSPGQNSTLEISINNVPAGQPFNVNVQFGSASQYISIPISDNTLLNQISNNGGTGTLNLPFSLPSSICDNVDDIQHQIDCYESVDIGDGQIVSKETARQMILACGTGGSAPVPTGPNDFCIDDSPQEICTVGASNGSTTQFINGSSCAASFPNLTYVDTASANSCTDANVGLVCGTCAFQLSANPNPDVSPVSPDEMMYDALELYRTNPEIRRQITFTASE